MRRALASLLFMGFWTACVLGDPGGSMRVDISRDTWVSDAGRERDCNLGASSRLKTKGIQEFSIVDIDPTRLAGRIVTRARLHLHVASPDAIQRRLTVSTLATDWVEGTAPSYQVQEGSASFNWAAQNQRRWAWPDSDITAVINGQGHTLWRFADATPVDAQGWQTVEVDPAVIAARVAGISHGFVIMDDVGSEYDRDGDRFTYHQFPNRFVHSRHQTRYAPYFTLWLGEEDRAAPDAPASIAAESANLPPGEANVTWNTPADHGKAGTIGFLVRWSKNSAFDWNTATPVPQYLVPMAAPSGAKVSMRLRDLALDAGQTITLGIRAVDRAGNVSSPAVASIKTSAAPAAIDLKPAAIKPFEPAGGADQFPAAGNVRISIIDALDKIHPVTGQMIPRQPDGYLTANHLWNASTRTVRLFAARNEFVDFQVLLQGQSRAIAASLACDETGANSPRPQLLRFRHVNTPAGPLPDPLLPLAGPLGIPAEDEQIAGQKFASLIAEIYVPHDAQPGLHESTLKISAGGQTVSLRVQLTVWNFTLGDRLSFIPEMNCYHLPEYPADIAWYRLAHAHRTCLNRLGYNWRGEPDADCSPAYNGRTFDWSRYDRHYGGILDGSAFADLPRAGVPVDSFYLPICENWPVPIEPHFKGGYWIERAFDDTYRPAFASGCAQFAQHISSRKWNNTLFEFYLNNKVYFKDKSWKRSSAPWIFDEPVNTQDFWALRYYGSAFHEAAAACQGDAHLAFRCDISRPQWQRDLLDGVYDVNVVGGVFRKYSRAVLDRKSRNGEVVINYGSANKITDANTHAVGWCVDTWCMGADGVLPWQTAGNAKSWIDSDPLSLFYPPRSPAEHDPAASVRLKAYRRGQQDVEYLVMLSETTKSPRLAVAKTVKDFLRLNATFAQNGDDDAGTVNYGGLSPQALWELRMRVGAALDAARPPAKRGWVDLSPPKRSATMMTGWKAGE